MPKRDVGEMYNTLEAGEYTAIITEVISVGTQTTKNGKELKKYWINCFIPALNEYKAISNFGITNWKSKSTYPNVGLYELICCALRDENPSNEVMKEYNVYDLAGKTVVLVTEIFQGFNNVTGIKIADEDIEATAKPVAMDIDEAIAADCLGALSAKVSKMVRASSEYLSFMSDNSAVATDKVNEDGTVSAFDNDPALRDEIKLSDVPF